VHRQVIDRLEQENADKSVLQPLRRAAIEGKEAIYAGNLPAFGRCMIANTEAQAALHPALVSQTAKDVIELAKKHGAMGWKVNGAGGEGGSVTILCPPEGERKRAFIQEATEMNPDFTVIPTYLSRMGLRRWETSD
jgi:D-glycero-alpha-D-manno-heptose-7-phosphate kinase